MEIQNLYLTIKGNNYKQQAEVFEELVMLAQTTSVDKLVQSKHLADFLSALGSLLVNTLNQDIQRMCLKFLQIYFRILAKAASTNNQQQQQSNSKYAQLVDVKINECLLEYLIACSVSVKIQLRQVSIDLIYTYMKLTDDFAGCFAKFVKYGIEGAASGSSGGDGASEFSRQFIDTTLHILINEEFSSRDFSPLIRALIKQAHVNPRCETGAYKCLSKIEMIVKRDKFNAYLSKLPQNLRNLYLEKRGQFRNKNNQ